MYGAGPDEDLSRVQTALAEEYGEVENGPDTDSLKAEYRYDGCYFEQAGLDKIRERWIEYLRTE